MKKNKAGAFLAVAILAVVGIGGYFIKDYYDGRSYTFTGYNEKGNAREVSFSYQTNDASKLLQPGQYLAVDVSKTIVIGQEVIAESKVPDAVKPFLK